MTKKEALILNQQEFLAKLGASLDGLTQKEAEKRLKDFGPNRLTKKRHPALMVLGRQFQSSLIYLLMVASLIAFWLKDYSDAAIIVGILIINTVLSFTQEYRSERIVEKLSKLIVKQAFVKRDGKLMLVDESVVVPGDTVVIREGDIVSADMRLLEAESLQVNESQLTGESMPATKIVLNHKSAQLPQDNSLVFAGTIVEKGMGVGIIYATGNNTELGGIAVLSTRTKKETQYEKSLQAFSVFLIRIVLTILGLIFVLKLIVTSGSADFTQLLLFVMALAIAVVPEALPVIAAVTMSAGANRLARKHVIVKRLASMEDLGNVNLLCTDKTGTITENKMTITKVISDNEELMLKMAFASIELVKGRRTHFQDSYDEAFRKYIPEKIKKEAKSFKIIKELAFNADARRRRVVVIDETNGKHYLTVIGDPEIMLGITGHSKRAEYQQGLINESRQGFRHLGVAYKEVQYSEGFDIIKNETDLAFLGYVTLFDPLRPVAKHAIERAEKLGIAVKILTGDNKEVAEYIGRQVGLITGNQRVYAGEELEKMSATEFESAISVNHVFARVSPSQKYNIIKSLKKNNVVAYQGDGINDAPSLKMADVAVAVQSATDIAKENADIVLLNKNLEVIINGITYGRVIFVNINKYIKHTMVGNFGNFVALAALYLFASDLPLLPIQVLLTALITDLPLIFVSVDTVDEKEVVRPEKHRPKELIFLSLLLGIPTAIFELIYFIIVKNHPQFFVQTGLFLFMDLQLMIFFSIRTMNRFWKSKKPPFVLDIAFAATFALSLLVIYVQPFQTWFKFASLPLYEIIIILFMGVVYFLVIDAIKVWYYKSFLHDNGKTNRNNHKPRAVSQGRIGKQPVLS